MARTYHALIGWIDLIIVMISGLLAWYIVEPISPVEPYIWFTFILACLAMPFGALMGLHISFRAQSMLAWMRQLTLLWGGFALLVVIVLWLTKESEVFSHLWLMSWLLIIWSGSVLWRLFAYFLISYIRAAGYNHKHIVIVGAGRLGRAVASKIEASRWSGFDVSAFFDDNPDKIGKVITSIPVLAADDLEFWLASNDVDEVWFALPLRAEPRLQEIVHSLRHTTVNIRYIPNLSGLRLLNHASREVLGFSMLDLSVSPMTEPMNRIIKSVEDKVIASIILLLISPLMFFVAVGIRWTSPGPVFYRQQRVGMNGKVFEMLKFRSMPVDIEKEDVYWGNAKTKTKTWFGAFIRKTSLDELPQFINVLKGDMSIVGPRPERPFFVERFKDEIPGYMQKHMVKAGITGWAQVHGWRGDTCLKTRIEFDLWYIENWSLWLDMKIIIATIFKGFVHKNAL